MKCLAVFSLFCALALAADPQIPRKAAEFGVQTGPGKYTWLSQYQGKTVILAFILTDCPHCQFTTGLLNGIQKDYAARGVQVIESAIEPMSSLHIPDFVVKLKVAFPVGYDDQTYAAKFLGYPENDPMFMPQIVFIDRNGTIRAQYSGDDTRLINDIQDKTLRDTLDRTIRDGANKTGAAMQKKGQAAVRPPAPKS